MDNCYENVFRLFVIHFIYILLTQIAHETRAHSVFFSSQSSKSTELTLGDTLKSVLFPKSMSNSLEVIWFPSSYLQVPN